MPHPDGHHTAEELDAQDEPGYRPVRRPFRSRGKTAYRIVTRCRCCGVWNAPWGYRVDILNNKGGQWYCAAHRPGEDYV